MKERIAISLTTKQLKELERQAQKAGFTKSVYIATLIKEKEAHG